jgi:hypothetical protein
LTYLLNVILVDGTKFDFEGLHHVAKDAVKSWDNDATVWTFVIVRWIEVD